jgi:hypothetical protein
MNVGVLDGRFREVVGADVEMERLATVLHSPRVRFGIILNVTPKFRKSKDCFYNSWT